MRKYAVVLLLCFGSFAATARGQTGVISLSVTSAGVSIVTDRSCTYVVIQENSATPSNAFTITLPGNANGVSYAAGTKFLFASGPGGFLKGQTIGTISVASGTVAFVGIESSEQPTVPVATLPNGTVATTQQVGDQSAQVATDSFVIQNGGSTPAGNNGDIQIKNGSALAAGHINDSGTALSASEPLSVAGNVSIEGPAPWVDVTAFGVRGGLASGAVTTATTTASSSSVTLASSSGFVVGDGIVISNAGAASGLSAPTGTVTVEGPTGSSTVSYECVNADYYEGLSPASAAITTTTAPQIEGAPQVKVSTYSITSNVATITFTTNINATAGTGEHVILSGPTMLSAGIDGLYLVQSAPAANQITVDVTPATGSGSGTSTDTGRLVNGAIITGITRSTAGVISITVDNNIFPVGRVIQIYGVNPRDLDGWYAVNGSSGTTLTINTGILPAATETGSLLSGAGQNYTWNTMGLVSWEWNLVNCGTPTTRNYVYANYGSGYTLIGSTLPKGNNGGYSNLFRDWGPRAEAGYAPPPAANVPSTPPAAATNNEYVGKVTAIAGNVVTVSPAPASSVSGANVFHDNSLAIQAADNFACSNGNPGVYFPPGGGNFVWNAPFANSTALYCYNTTWLVSGSLTGNDTVEAYSGWTISNRALRGGNASPQFGIDQYVPVSGVGNPIIAEQNAGGLAPLIIKGMSFSASSNGQTDVYSDNAYATFTNDSFWANSYESSTPLVLGPAGFTDQLSDLNVQGSTNMVYGNGQPQSLMPLGVIDIQDGTNGISAPTISGMNTFIGRGIELDSTLGSGGNSITPISLTNVETYQAPWQPIMFAYSLTTNEPQLQGISLSNITCDSNIVPVFANVSYNDARYTNISFSKISSCGNETGPAIPDMVTDGTVGGQSADVASAPGTTGTGTQIGNPYIYGTNLFNRSIEFGSTSNSNSFEDAPITGLSATASGTGTWSAATHTVQVEGAGWDNDYGIASTTYVTTNGSQGIQIACTIPSGYKGVYIAVDSRGQGSSGAVYTCPVTLTGDNFGNYFQLTPNAGSPEINGVAIQAPIFRLTSGVFKDDFTGSFTASRTVAVPDVSGTMGLFTAAPAANTLICTGSTTGSMTTSGCPGGSGPGTGTQYALPYWATTSTLGSVAGYTGQIPVFQNAAAPVAASPGLPDGNGGAHVTTTPYTVACDSSTTILDRATTIVFDSGASVVTLPDHTASGCGAHLPFTLINESGGALTVNRGGSDTINVTGNVSKSIAATSFTIPDSGSAIVNNGEGAIWNARVTEPPTGGGAVVWPTGAVAPTFSPTPGSYGPAQTVSVTCPGSATGYVSLSPYTTPASTVSVTASGTVEGSCQGAGFANDNATGAYTITNAVLTYVQMQTAYCNTAGACVVAITPTNTGDLLRVSVGLQDNGTAGTPTVADGPSSACAGSSTYGTAFLHKDALLGGNVTPGEFYTLSVAAGVTDVCVTPNTSTVLLRVVVTEYHRTSGSWSLDQVSAVATGTGLTQTAGSITTAANPVLVGGDMYQFTNAIDSFTGTGGYTVRGGGLFSGQVLDAGDQIFTATGAYAFTSSLPNSDAWAGYTVSYK